MLLNCGAGLLRVPWIARQSNQSILKEINPEYSLEGLMLKLNLYYFGYMMQRIDSLEKTLSYCEVDFKVTSAFQWLVGCLWLLSVEDFSQTSF